MQTADYEHPFFRSCTEEEAVTKIPLTIEVRNVVTDAFRKKYLYSFTDEPLDADRGTSFTRSICHITVSSINEQSVGSTSLSVFDSNHTPSLEQLTEELHRTMNELLPVFLLMSPENLYTTPRGTLPAEKLVIIEQHWTISDEFLQVLREFVEFWPHLHLMRRRPIGA